jgi:hypothetical protein
MSADGRFKQNEKLVLRCVDVASTVEEANYNLKLYIREVTLHHFGLNRSYNQKLMLQKRISTSWHYKDTITHCIHYIFKR